MGAWTAIEVEAVVADYFEMLTLELRGESYQKAAHRRALSKRLNSRSEGSIERKHQNISAVLIELGQPWIDGYKPLFNYQRLLRDVIVERLAVRRDLQRTMEKAVEAPAKVAPASQLNLRLEEPPRARERVTRSAESRDARQRPPCRLTNYLERESRNASLGRAGEALALEFERTRLLRAGKQTLAEKVDQVSVTRGDGLGYDIHSFETNGADRFIEVKSTAYGKETPFFVSRNEVEVSRELGGQYQLYRIFKLRDGPRMFAVPGSLNESFKLLPEVFRARVA